VSLSSRGPDPGLFPSPSALPGLPPGAALTRRLDLMTQTQTVAGNAVELALDSRLARAVLLADLEDAQRSIHLQFYILAPGRFATELVACLRRRAAAGVAVRLVVDPL